jgi:L-alanine-DL-glutamate epimerase-like enolase superfamily enzyme
MLIEVPLKGTYRTSHGDVSLHKSVILILETIDGLIGIGQADPIPKYSAETAEEIYVVIKKYLCPLLIGESPFNIPLIMERINDIFPDPIHMESKAIINMALYDLLGKIIKEPIYKILGGMYREEIPVVGWVGREKPDEMAKNAIKKVENGYKAIKVKISNSYDDIDAIAKIRDAIGYNIELRIDANESLLPINFLKKLEKYEPKWIEQPAPRRKIDYLTHIKREINIPILVDESISDLYSLLYVINNHAADYIKLKVLKQGGLDNVKKFIKLCESEGIKCVIGHGFDMNFSASAELQLIASCKLTQIEYINEVGGPFDKMKDDIVKYPLDFDKGSFKVPNKPGLGLILDENKLYKYKIDLL